MPRPAQQRIRVLLVCEKPSAAECVVAALHPDVASRDESASQIDTRAIVRGLNRAPELLPQFDESLRLRVWQFCDTYESQPAEFIVTSVKGHLHHMEFKQRHHRHWYDRGLDELLQPQVAEAEHQLEDKSTVEQLLSLSRTGIDVLILWLDCDPEGEAIGLEIREYLGRENVFRSHTQMPSLERERRARFRSLHPSDVRVAINSLQHLDVPLAQSVQAREELDLRIGFAFTRLLSMLCRTRVPRALALLQSSGSEGPCNERVAEGDHFKIMSYGPCQSPTLYLVCQRNEARLAAAMEEPDVLEIELELDQDADGRSHYAQVLCSFACQPISEASQLQELRVLETKWSEPGIQLQAKVSVVKEHEEFLRPLPPNLIAVQRRASQELKLSPKEVEDVLEQLYLKGAITYPRTESQVYPAHFSSERWQELLRGLTSHGNSERESEAISKHASQLLGNPRVQPRQDGIDVIGFEPIRPLMPRCTSHWNSQAARVWRLVVRMTLASMSADAHGFKYTVKLHIQGTNMPFAADGFVPAAGNTWLNILSPESADVMLSSSLRQLAEYQSIPRMHTRAARLIRSSLQRELTESELLTQMEKERIGTDASAGKHIDMLVKRGYAVLHPVSRVIEPLPLGRALVLGFLGAGCGQLIEPTMRAEMERRCRRVAEGELCERVVSEESRHMLQQFYQLASRSDMFCSMLELSLAEAKEVIDQYAPNIASGESHVWSTYQGSSTQNVISSLPQSSTEEWTLSSTDCSCEGTWNPKKMPVEAEWISNVQAHMQFITQFQNAKLKLACKVDSPNASSFTFDEPAAIQMIQSLQRAASACTSTKSLDSDEISHRLVFLLRHGQTLNLTQDGWCQLNEVLSDVRLAGCGHEDIEAVARGSIDSRGQPRFELRDGWIRATGKRSRQSVASTDPSADFAQAHLNENEVSINRTHVSHVLASLLRHNPRFNIGWCGVNEVLSDTRLAGCRQCDIEAVVQESISERTGLPRLQLRSGFIRAIPDPQDLNTAASQGLLPALRGPSSSAMPASAPASAPSTCTATALRTQQWMRFLSPEDGSPWWCCEAEGRHFFESNPAPWKKFQDPLSGRYWWHNEISHEYFFEP